MRGRVMSDQTIQQPTIISRKWLDERGACRAQAQLFERVWTDGVAVTREALELSAKAGLILEWFAGQVLPRSAYAAFQSQRAALYAAYQSQCNTLYADYRSQRDTLLINALCDLYESDAPALPSSSCATEAARK